LLLAPRSRKRFARKLAVYEGAAAAGILAELELARRVTAIVAFTKVADAAGFRRRLIAQRGWFQGVPNALCAAAAGTTPPATLGRPTATGTSLVTGTTTTASAWFSPQLTGLVDATR